jgi:hypothetical protein
MLLTMGLRGTPYICIWGSPCSLGGLGQEGSSCLLISSVTVDSLGSDVVLRSVVSVESLASLQ